MYAPKILTELQILFSAVCQVYLGEIKASSEVHDNDYVGSLHMSLDHILAIMEDLGTVCPLMGWCRSFYRQWVRAHGFSPNSHPSGTS